jgi:hypothetical protein
MDNGKWTMDNGGCGYRRGIADFATHMDTLFHLISIFTFWGFAVTSVD